jgi:hypothetical protein
MAESATSRPLEDGGDQSVGDLVSLALRDVTKLIRCELDLARLELSADARRIGMAGALLGTAAFGGFLVLVMLSFALAEGLITVGIWAWAAFLIAAGVWVVLIAIAVMVVYLKMRRMSGLRKTRATVQDDLALLRRGDEAAVPATAEG